MKAPAPEPRIEAMKPVFGDVPAPLDAHAEELPGPTGELNRLSNHARGVVLCLGPDKETALEQAAMALSQGNKVVVVAPGTQDTVDRAAKPVCRSWVLRACWSQRHCPRRVVSRQP